MVLDRKSSQEYLVNAGVSQGSIPDPTLFLLFINHLPGDLTAILLSILMKLLSTLNVIRNLVCANN